ncbi:hypothetical protein C8F01DRAFT_1129193 [Mycena amicta]|nr:hypothetical protein C8F01DRAFT_1129193 [Mycena amicta]
MLASDLRKHVLLGVLLAGGAGVTQAQSPTAIHAHAANSQRRQQQHHINFYYARQLNEQTSSSSYDYWWPYPPAGAPTTTQTLPAETNTLPSTTPVLAFSLEATQSIPSSSSSSFLSSSSTFVSASDSDQLPMSTIDALPPTNSTLGYHSPHKLSMISSNNLIYIISGCGVAGLLVGGITAWCIYGCITRRRQGRRGESAVLRRGRKSYGTLEVGPEYRPPTPRFEEEKEERDDADEGKWLGNEDILEEKLDDVGEEESDPETQAFLHPQTARQPPLGARPTRHKSVVSSRAPSPTPSGRTSLFFDRPDSTDAVPWESLRHKSIKREILERLRDDGDQETTTERISRRPWKAHGRHDSDVLLSDAQAELSRMSSRVTTATTAALSRASSSVTAGIGMGFRIMSESPAGTPQRERNADVFRWPSIKEEKDRYTHAPMRVVRSRSQSPEKPSAASRPTSPVKLQRARSPPVQRAARGRRARGNTIVEAEDSGVSTSEIRRVLPQSPPCVSSPVLEETLCFTPVPADTAQMASFATFGALVAEDELSGVKSGRRA